MKIGLALGGGAARGFAHILVLEAVEEMGLEIAGIAGTSIGALMGASYAARPEAADLREYCLRYFEAPTRALAKLVPTRRGGVFRNGLWGGMTPDAVKLMEAALPPVPRLIEELDLPFTAVATDFYSGQAVRLSRGSLIPAVAASAAIPGIIAPVLHEGRVLVDGGLVEPVPYACVPGAPDLILACDVNGAPQGAPPALPSPLQSAFATGQIVMGALLREQLRHARPDVLVAPKLDHYRASDFLKATDILRDAAPLKDEVKRKLDAAIGARRDA